MIHVRGNHEIILVLHKIQQPAVQVIRNRRITVDPDIPGPISPEFLHGFVGIESSRVHIPELVFIREIGKVFLKPFAGIDKARGGR